MATHNSRIAFGVTVLGLVAMMAPPTGARADDAVLHRVTYTVTADQPVQAGVYYRDIDPPTWADYSHNPYLYSPKVDVSLGPTTPWVLDVMLADPDRWAMIAITQDLTRPTHPVHCALAVDGIVADTADGPHGALCSLRPR
ncbi:MAG: hypothetical protein ABWY93_27640 [Mycobacterium sp.]